jgi:hypothetical protein
MPANPQPNINFFAKNWRDLIRPKLLEMDSESLTAEYGKFTCEPLERGFGITIGNSLRRVLLSSIQGAAVTAVKIDGACEPRGTGANDQDVDRELFALDIGRV